MQHVDLVRGPIERLFGLATLVVFTADNGCAQLGYCDSGVFKLGKGKPWEGGVRVPGIVRWPGKVPADTTCTQLCTMMDLLPTITAINNPTKAGEIWYSCKKAVPTALAWAKFPMATLVRVTMVCRIFRPSACSMARCARASRRPAWATASRST